MSGEKKRSDPPTLKDFLEYMTNALSGLHDRDDSPRYRRSLTIWDFVTALRGPDAKPVYAQNIKGETTAIIRHFVNVPSDFCVVRHDVEKFDALAGRATDREEEMWKNHEDFSPGHFLSHFNYAVSALKAARLWPTKERKPDFIIEDDVI